MLARDKHLSLFWTFVNYGRKNLFIIESRLKGLLLTWPSQELDLHINTLKPTSLLTNIRLRWNGSPGTNTLAYLASFSVMKQRYFLNDCHPAASVDSFAVGVSQEGERLDRLRGAEWHRKPAGRVPEGHGPRLTSLLYNFFSSLTPRMK